MAFSYGASKSPYYKAPSGANQRVTPVDWSNYLVAKRRTNDTYEHGLMRDEFNRNQAVNDFSGQLRFGEDHKGQARIRGFASPLQRQFQQQRDQLDGGLASRGLMNSGIRQRALGQHALGQSDLLADLTRQYQSRMAAINQARTELGLARNASLADIATQLAGRRAQGAM